MKSTEERLRTAIQKLREEIFDLELALHQEGFWTGILVSAVEVEAAAHETANIVRRRLDLDKKRDENLSFMERKG